MYKKSSIKNHKGFPFIMCSFSAALLNESPIHTYSFFFLKFYFEPANIFQGFFLLGKKILFDYVN